MTTALAAAGVDHRLVAYEGAPHSFFDRKAAQFADASAAAWSEVLGFIRARTNPAPEPPRLDRAACDLAAEPERGQPEQTHREGDQRAELGQDPRRPSRRRAAACGRRPSPRRAASPWSQRPHDRREDLDRDHRAAEQARASSRAPGRARSAGARSRRVSPAASPRPRRPARRARRSRRWPAGRPSSTPNRTAEARTMKPPWKSANANRPRRLAEHDRPGARRGRVLAS